MLSCTHCGQMDGWRSASSYDVARCPLPGNIDNNNGMLQCSGLPNVGGIPEGG